MKYEFNNKMSIELQINKNRRIIRIKKLMYNPTNKGKLKIYFSRNNKRRTNTVPNTCIHVVQITFPSTLVILFMYNSQKKIINIEIYDHGI